MIASMSSINCTKPDIGDSLIVKSYNASIEANDLHIGDGS